MKRKLLYLWMYGLPSLVLASSAITAALFALGLLPFVQIRENSMAPALVSGDLVLLDRTAYLWNHVQVGDVLVFDKLACSEQPENLSFSQNFLNNSKWNHYFFQNLIKTFRPNMEKSKKMRPAPAMRNEPAMIKRSVLLPKMRLQWRGSQLYIPSRQGYVRVDENVRQSLAGLAQVPEGFIFVLGDNLTHSLDSRNYGLVALSKVRGKAIWFQRGLKRGAAQNFAHVPHVTGERTPDEQTQATQATPQNSRSAAFAFWP